MPILTPKSIYSFSSEDPLFPATNLLSSAPTTGKKWKCQFAGEPSIEVVLLLEKPSTITAIDIGNEHSAFVEVLVSKNGSSNFQQILLMSSFMSPMESRNSDPTNRVRCFGRTALVETIVESKSKWDLVKIVCTQPFNKQVQYGLSFIKLHSTDANGPNDDVNEPSSIPSKLFGNFQIREESPESDSESPQSLFLRWKMSRNDTDNKEPAQSVTLRAAAAIREATTASLKTYSPHINRTAVAHKRVENRLDQQDTDEVANKKNRNRLELMYEDEDDKPNEKLDKIILKERERLEREKEKEKDEKKKQEKNKSKKVSSTSFTMSTPKTSRNTANKTSVSDELGGTETSRSKTKRTSSSPISDVQPVKRIKETKERIYKPFHKLLEGVVLVISGIQNPARANIRQHALDMGAKYKPDWERSCTHLICAFKNTPKYNQVHGQGKIITKDWILECHKKKMRIPWRRFALDSDDAKGPESEDEIFDKSLEPSASTSQRATNSKMESTSSSQTKVSQSPNKRPIVLSDDEASSDHNLSHRYNLNSSRVERNEFLSSGSDTEDEVNRVLEKKSLSIVSRTSDDIYNATTEEESEAAAAKPNSKSISPLPEFFKQKSFYLSDNISSTEEIKLKRFVTVYGGEMTTDAAQSDYIISNTPQATPSNYKGEVVKPLWIFECNDLETLLPTKRYNFSNW